MVIANRLKIKEFIKAQVRAAVYAIKFGGKVNARQGMERLGLYAESLVKQRIKKSKSWAKPNSKATIMAKTRTKGKEKNQPLVDTGRLASSILYRIAKDGV